MGRRWVDDVKWIEVLLFTDVYSGHRENDETLYKLIIIIFSESKIPNVL